MGVVAGICARISSNAVTEPDSWPKAEQRLLYRAVRRLIGQRVFLPYQPGTASSDPSEGKFTFAWLSATALGLHASTPGWESNFRAGRLSRKKAADIFDWLQRHFPDEARALVNEIARAYGAATQSPWEAFIREYGVFGTLSIRRSRPGVSTRIEPLGELETEEMEKVTAHVPLHRPFNFHIDGGRGFVVGLQWVRGQWFALRLSDDRVGFRISALRSTTGDVLLDGPKLIENEEPGLHRFVFIETMEADGPTLESLLKPDMPIPETVLARLTEVVQTLPGRRFKLHRLNAMFVVAGYYDAD
jgi:hypothetical protein